MQPHPRVNSKKDEIILKSSTIPSKIKCKRAIKASTTKATILCGRRKHQKRWNFATVRSCFYLFFSSRFDATGHQRKLSNVLSIEGRELPVDSRNKTPRGQKNNFSFRSKKTIWNDKQRERVCRRPSTEAFVSVQSLNFCSSNIQWGGKVCSMKL